jgi:putative oxidoreductase
MYSEHTITQIIGQVIIAAFFIQSGIPNIRNKNMWKTRMAEQAVPLPGLVLFTGFVLQYVGALMVLFDFFTSIGAIILIVFLVVATLLFQRYWTASDPNQQRVMRLSFWANVCIVGGLLLLVRL